MPTLPLSFQMNLLYPPNRHCIHLCPLKQGAPAYLLTQQNIELLYSFRNQFLIGLKRGHLSVKERGKMYPFLSHLSTLPGLSPLTCPQTSLVAKRDASFPKPFQSYSVGSHTSTSMCSPSSPMVLSLPCTHSSELVCPLH